MTAQHNATEVWKTIPHYSNYEASNMGRIRNSNSGKVLAQVKVGSRGHLAVKVGGGRKATNKYVHRLILMAHVGMPEDGQIACHKNDIKSDNKIDNLYWGTYKTNTEDAIRNGRFKCVDHSLTTKYPSDVIKKIKAEYKGKRGDQSALAIKYGMSVSNVHLIVHGYSRAA